VTNLENLVTKTLRKTFYLLRKTNSVNLQNLKTIYIHSNIQQMQNYTEFNFKIQPLEPWNEILMAELIEIGFDSFTEELEGILLIFQLIW
jgi:hypothetical protein